MSKYESLTRHLKSRKGERVAMTFAELEAVLGFRLPVSARQYRPWWANSNHGHVQARGWMDAGFESQDVDLSAEKLVFVRLNAVETDRSEEKSGNHPLLGCMKGTITIAPGVDLTEPMYSDAEMEAFLDRKSRLLEGLG